MTSKHESNCQQAMKDVTHELLATMRINNACRRCRRLMRTRLAVPYDGDHRMKGPLESEPLKFVPPPPPPPRIAHVHYVISGQSIVFLPDKNAGLAVSRLFWPFNCIKIGAHVEWHSTAQWPQDSYSRVFSPSKIISLLICDN